MSLEPVHFEHEGHERRFLVRRVPSPTLIVIWAHGGSHDVDTAAENMAQRISPLANRVDIFPNGMPDQDGLYAKWVRQDSTWFPEGTDGGTDFRYFKRIREFCESHYPGVPVAYCGYSGGAGFIKAWAEVEDLRPLFVAIGDVKNLPLQRQVGDDGKFASEAPLPAWFFWWATNDPLAFQGPNPEHPEHGHLYLDEALELWAETFEAGPFGDVSTFTCGRRFNIVDSYFFEAPLRLNVERRGSHKWLPCIDEKFTRFCLEQREPR